MTNLSGDAFSLLTPRMRDMLEKMEKANRPPFYSMTPQEARVSYEKIADVLEVAKAQLPRVEDLSVPVRDGGSIPLRIYSASGDKSALLPMVLYVHGGGFTIGSIATHDLLCREICRLSGCIVASVGYRLAPEFPFPTAVNDCWDALSWLAKNAQELGVDAERVAVCGDSAGGTLATVTAINARDNGLALRLQALFYPGVLPFQNSNSHKKFGEGFVISETQIGWFFDQYIPSEQREDWRFSPIHTPDLEGVAPAWIGLAECDPLVDEGTLYADNLRLAGVPVDLEIYRGVTHEFIKMGRLLPEARQAHRDVANALKAALFDL